VAQPESRPERVRVRFRGRSSSIELIPATDAGEIWGEARLNFIFDSRFPPSQPALRLH